MQWVRFDNSGTPQFGVLRDGMIYPTMATWADILTGVQPAAEAIGIMSDSVRLLAPLGRPGKIVCVGKNYPEHARETKAEPPTSPILFAKFPSALNNPGGALVWSGALTQAVDFEAELAVIIGRTARGVSEADALSYVFGYTCANDVSARDLQFADGQWVRGKSLDSFGPMGPVLVTADEIPDPQTLALRSELNGEIMQEGHTSQMLFSVRFLIAFCSRSFTLEPGDVLLTGTPSGVGHFREPPLHLKHGDTIAVEVERIGRLENTCVVE
jgi:2-keto-4-pentenoate hydratase/2-oxohepta-3-ene-1,7-dioic acid hydratase in catechol pathway